MTTPNFELPEWIQDQNQPHITVNTALRILECLAQLRVQAMDLTAPPTTPDDGDCYIPASGAAGEWAGHDNDVAMFIGGGWVFRTPKYGWEAWVVDDALKVRYDDTMSPAEWMPTEST